MEKSNPQHLLNIRHFIDDAKCFQTVREMHWPDGVRCTRCNSAHVIKHGRDETQKIATSIIVRIVVRILMI